MKYFNSTKVADSRKKIRMPFSDGYKNATEAKRSYHQQKREDVERAWNVVSEKYAKERLLYKIQHGESGYWFL